MSGQLAPWQAGRDAGAISARPAARTAIDFDRLADALVPFLLPLSILWLWVLNARLGWIPPQVLPTPRSVILAFRTSLASGELQSNLRMTLVWLLEGYAIGGILGVAIGVWMGISEKAADYLGPSVKAVSYVPVLGWLPLWLVLLGVGDALKVVLVAQATLSPIVFNVFDGIRGTPAQTLELGRVFRFSRAQQLRYVILPAAFPSAWAGIRFGLTKAWLALVAIEILASTSGLGFMMVNARSLYQLDMMFVSVITIGVFGYLLDRVLQAIETRVLRWRPPTAAIL